MNDNLQTRKLFKDKLELANVVSELLEYAEYDEQLSKMNGEKTYNFNNVVMMMTEKELKKLKKIIK